jgi:hypothetical protein
MREPAQLELFPELANTKTEAWTTVRDPMDGLVKLKTCPVGTLWVAIFMGDFEHTQYNRPARFFLLHTDEGVRVVLPAVAQLKAKLSLVRPSARVRITYTGKDPGEFGAHRFDVQTLKTTSAPF